MNVDLFFLLRCDIFIPFGPILQQQPGMLRKLINFRNNIFMLTVLDRELIVEGVVCCAIIYKMSSCLWNFGNRTIVWNL